jgi:hypothetical protein
MARGLKVDLTRHLRGRGMSAIWAPPFRDRGLSSVPTKPGMAEHARVFEGRNALNAQSSGLGFFRLTADSNDGASSSQAPLGVSTTFMQVSMSKAWAIALLT